MKKKKKNLKKKNIKFIIRTCELFIKKKGLIKIYITYIIIHKKNFNHKKGTDLLNNKKIF